MLGVLLAVAALAAAVAYLAASYAVAATLTVPDRVALGGPPQIARAYEDIALTAADGVGLSGWFFPSGRDRAAVVVHGRSQNRREWRGRSERIADFLIADGYSVVMFDLRAHGESAGSRFSLGFFERKDVAAAIGFLRARGFAKERIAVIGISMGGASALAYLTLDAGVGPMVIDSSYADVPTAVGEWLPALGYPAFLAPGALLVARVLWGIDVDAVRPATVVRAHPERPFLFIHCDTDEQLDPHHARDLRAASTNADSVLWIASNCRHAGASDPDEHPVEYRERVLSFLRSQLP